MTSDSASAAVQLDPAALGQVAYHMRCAAGLAVRGRADESAGHAVLAWSLLEAVGGDRLREAVAALDLPDDVGALDGDAPASLRRSTEELALQLCAHFTSEGRHDLAQLYQDAHRLLTTRG